MKLSLLIQSFLALSDYQCEEFNFQPETSVIWPYQYYRQKTNAYIVINSWVGKHKMRGGIINRSGLIQDFVNREGHNPVDLWQRENVSFCEFRFQRGLKTQLHVVV